MREVSVGIVGEGGAATASGHKGRAWETGNILFLGRAAGSNIGVLTLTICYFAICMVFTFRDPDLIGLQKPRAWLQNLFQVIPKESQGREPVH